MKADLVGHLMEMLELEEEETAEYIEVFLISLDDCCRQLKAEEENPNFASLRIITHTLCGFSENMGAMDILARAKALNAAAKAGNAEACRQEIAEIFTLQELYHQ